MTYDGLSDQIIRRYAEEARERGAKKLVLFESNALGTCTLPAWGGGMQPHAFLCEVQNRPTDRPTNQLHLQASNDSPSRPKQEGWHRNQ